GHALWGQGRWAEAEAALRQGLSNLESVAPDYFWTARFHALLGKCAMEQGRYGDAESELTRGFERESRNQGANPKRLRDMAESLVDLYTRWEAAEPGEEYAAKADPWREKLIQLDERNLQSVPER